MPGAVMRPTKKANNTICIPQAITVHNSFSSIPDTDSIHLNNGITFGNDFCLTWWRVLDIIARKQ